MKSHGFQNLPHPYAQILFLGRENQRVPEPVCTGRLARGCPAHKVPEVPRFCAETSEERAWGPTIFPSGEDCSRDYAGPHLGLGEVRPRVNVPIVRSDLALEPFRVFPVLRIGSNSDTALIAVGVEQSGQEDPPCLKEVCLCPTQTPEGRMCEGYNQVIHRLWLT